jgi:hypothetical protein
MNFISHFYLDRELNNSWFFAGVSTPDLVSVFDRTVRLKENTLPLPMENEASPEELSFYQGVLRHFEVDKIFHTSPFFYTETKEINRRLHAVFPDGEMKRGFFVSHVLFELLLDKLLIQQDPTLLPDFYRHLTTYPLQEYVKLTEWVTGVPMPSYEGFLGKFIEKQYLYRYTDWQHVIYILKRIVLGVGIKEVAYLHDPRFLSVMEAYEEELKERHLAAFTRLNEQLCEV